MKVSIPLTGTRGDVQPAVALGVELCRRGHDVLLGAPPNLVDFATRAGLTAVPCGPDVAQLYSSPAGQAALAAGSSLALMRLVAKQMADYAAAMNGEVTEVCRGADVVVSTLLTEDRAASVTEALDIPIVTMHGFPGRASRTYPFPGALPPSATPPAVVNRATWLVSENLRRMVFARYLNQLRADLGLRRSLATPAEMFARRGVREIQIYDPVVVPGLAEEWGEQRPLVGFLPLERQTREAIGEIGASADAPEAVSKWIEAGPAPVYCGFGSMPIRNAAVTLEMVREVARRTDTRVLISAGWSDLELPGTQSISPDDRVVVTGALAHDVVLPRCVAAVHHGGIGTTFESLRAGLPTLICSVSFDQPMWGGQVTRLGVGAHLPFTDLGATKLTEALQSILDPQVASRAQELARQLNARTDATVRTADLVEAAAR